MSAGVISFMLIKVFHPRVLCAARARKLPVRVGLMAVAANPIFNVVIFIGFFKLIDWHAGAYGFGISIYQVLL